jgi:hypothetical protein
LILFSRADESFFMCEHMKMVKASSILYSEMGGGKGGKGVAALYLIMKSTALFLLRILSS